MATEDREIILRIAQTIEHKYLRVAAIREMAGSEENYRLIIREIDRVKAQLIRARACHAVATLTVVEWFTILERFDWKCAYCQEKPFRALSHIISQREGGTTATNCVPACHSCIPRPDKKLVLSRMSHPQQTELS